MLDSTDALTDDILQVTDTLTKVESLVEELCGFVNQFNAELCTNLSRQSSVYDILPIQNLYNKDYIRETVEEIANVVQSVKKEITAVKSVAFRLNHTLALKCILSYESADEVGANEYSDSRNKVSPTLSSTSVVSSEICSDVAKDETLEHSKTGTNNSTETLNELESESSHYEKFNDSKGCSRMASQSSDIKAVTKQKSEKELKTVIKDEFRDTTILVRKTKAQRVNNSKPKQQLQCKSSLVEAFPCYKCERTFNKCKKLREHVVKHCTVTVDISTIICSICGKRCESEKFWISHMRQHDATTQFKCSSCNDTIYNKDSVLHKAVCCEKNKKDHACSDCREHFQTKSELLLHKKHFHTVKKKCKFENCEAVFDQVKPYRRHVKEHALQDERYKCHICDKCFATGTNLRVHETTHSTEPTYSCSQCSKAFTHPSKLKAHAACHTRAFSCHICGKAFPGNNKLKRHLASHSSSRTVPCPRCHKLFLDRVNMTIHRRRLHDNAAALRAVCDACGKQFSNKYALRQHAAIHAGRSMTHRCSSCDRFYSSSHNLQQHVRRVHSEEEPRREFTCDVCGKQFGSKSVLKQHGKIHTGDKAFQCEFCTKSFYQNSALKVHLRVHTGERPYKCTLCSASFKKNINLKSHMNSRHPLVEWPPTQNRASVGNSSAIEKTTRN